MKRTNFKEHIWEFKCQVITINEMLKGKEEELIWNEYKNNANTLVLNAEACIINDDRKINDQIISNNFNILQLSNNRN